MNLDDLTRPAPARQEAEEAARELARATERLGVPLEDIEVTAPCRTCRRTGYTVQLGTLHPDEARALARALSRALASVPGPALASVPGGAGGRSSLSRPR